MYHLFLHLPTVCTLLSPAQFKKALAEVPKGLKTAIKIEVATRLDNGTFDSIQKVRAVDEICGTELEKMI